MSALKTQSLSEWLKERISFTAADKKALEVFTVSPMPWHEIYQSPPQRGRLVGMLSCAQCSTPFHLDWPTLHAATVLRSNPVVKCPHCQHEHESFDPARFQWMELESKPR